MDPKVLYNLSYGVYIVGAFKDGRPVGCTINTCFQITAQNPVLAISLNKNNFTLEAIKETGRFSVLHPLGGNRPYADREIRILQFKGHR